MIRTLAASLALLLAGVAAPALAADKDSCAVVRMSDPGWMDITSTNALAGTVLEALGYTPKVENVSVPISYQSLKNGQIDVFLGSWWPAQKSTYEPLVQAGQVEVLTPNLKGAKFTLAVPTYVADGGVKSYADLATHKDKFGAKIYGIESGSAANGHLKRMIDTGDFGLKDWSLVESSESGMLAQVTRAARRNEWVVFLGWEPHPMNSKLPLTYLTGGDAYFGPDYGSSTVHTLARKGFSTDCPNLAKLLTQVTFTIPMEGEMMTLIGEEKVEADEAAARTLKANPAVLDAWLAGVTTRDGKDGLAAVKAKVAG